jgi:hypothetical protein
MAGLQGDRPLVRLLLLRRCLSLQGTPWRLLQDVSRPALEKANVEIARTTQTKQSTVRVFKNVPVR